MGRAAGGEEQTAPFHSHSSIALLQERFRQLERAKEIRQERELCRTTLPSSHNHQYSHDDNKVRRRSHTEFLFPPAAEAVAKPSSSKLSLSLWPADSSPVAEEMRRINVVALPWVTLKDDHLYHTYSADVDTSLHL